MKIKYMKKLNLKLILLPFLFVIMCLDLIAQVQVQSIIANAPQYSLGNSTLVTGCNKEISFTIKNTTASQITINVKLNLYESDCSSYKNCVFEDKNITIPAYGTKTINKNTAVSSCSTCSNGLGGTTGLDANYTYCLKVKYDLSSDPNNYATPATGTNNKTFYVQSNTDNCNTSGGTTYTISGNAGSIGVSIDYGDGITNTNSSGNYSFTVDSGWDGTVTPTKSGCTFNPPDKDYSNVLSNKTNQNYTINCGSGGTTPAAPTGVSATAISSSSISVSWNSSSGADYYKIYDNNGSLLANNVSSTSKTFNGLTSETQYCYKVKACSNADGCSDYSLQDCATTSSSGTSPIANFSASPTSGTAPLSVQFTNTSTGNPTDYNWDFGDGVHSVSISPSHTFNSVGAYSVILTANNSYGSDTKAMTINVTAPLPTYTPPTLSTPANNYVVSSIPNNMSYSWNTNGNPLNAIYILRVKDNTTGNLIVNNYNAGNNSSVTLSQQDHNNELILGHSYVWNVTTVNPNNPIYPTYPTTPGQLTSTAFNYEINPVPSIISAPVCGNINQCNGRNWSNCGSLINNSWNFWQRIGHDLGITGARDYWAWDANMCSDNDNGKPVYAVEDGYIVGSVLQGAPLVNGWGGNSFGQVLIRHGDNTVNLQTDWFSGYLHMNKLGKTGFVSKGDLIGYVSHISTASNLPNHLHFAVYYYDAQVNNLQSVTRTIVPLSTCGNNSGNSYSVNTYQSILSGAKVFVKQFENWNFWGSTDENGKLNFISYADALNTNDSIWIISSNSEEIKFRINNQLNLTKFNIPMIKLLISSDKILYPKVEPINKQSIYTNNTLNIQVTANNLNNYNVYRYDNDGSQIDTFKIVNQSVTNSNVNIFLLDTGRNEFVFQLIGNDTIDIYKEFYYVPNNLVSTNSQTLNVICNSNNIGAKLYLNNQFIKSLNNVIDAMGLYFDSTLNSEYIINVCKPGFKDEVYRVDNTTNSININLVPVSYSSITDSLVINFSQNSKIFYWKNITTQSYLNTTNNNISLKQFNDNFAGLGFVPKTRKFVFRNLSTPNWSKLRTAIALDQIEDLDNDSIYLMNIKNGNQFTKLPIDSVGLCSYDSITQKLSYDNINFSNGAATTEELVIMKKLKPITVTSAVTEFDEDVATTFPFSHFFTDPDVINDLKVQYISSPNLTVQIVGQELILQSVLNWNGTTNITLVAYHDGLPVVSTFPVFVKPVNDPPEIKVEPSLRHFCYNTNFSLLLSDFVTDVDNPITEVTISSQSMDVLHDAHINFNQTSNFLTFKSIVPSPIERIYPIALEVRDILDSVGRDTMYIKLDANPLAGFIYTPACYGDSAIFTNQTIINPGNYSCLWNFGDGTTSIIENPKHKYAQPGTYIVQLIVTCTTGCADTITKPIIQAASLSVSVNNFSNATCFGLNNGYINVTANDGTAPYTYLWNTMPQQSTSSAMSLVAGSYTVTVTDDIGCQQTISQAISQPPTELVSLMQIQNISCHGYNDGKISINTSGGIVPYQYTWNSGVHNFMIDQLSQGTYSVTVSDASGCSNTLHAVINEPDLLVINAKQDTLMCKGSVFQLDLNVQGGTLPYSYVWWCPSDFCNFNASGIINPIVSPIMTTTYFSNVTDNNNCLSNTDSIIVSIMPDIIIHVEKDTAIFEGESVQLIAISNQAISYLWSPTMGLNNAGIQNPLASPHESVVYTITASDSLGCIAQSSVEIIVFRNLKIPTAFTPNGDGYNDKWEITNIEDYPNCVVEIYDRFGNLIFKSNGYAQAWDGKAGDKDLPIGSYFFIIDIQKDKDVLKGTVSIIKE